MGVILRNANDPPGQRCIYICPGNYEDGNYRITTFQNYPDKNPSRRKALALSGFYYTGFKDRVRCYSCAVCVEQWNEDDDPNHPSWHDQNCSQAKRILQKWAEVLSKPTTRTKQSSMVEYGNAESVFKGDVDEDFQRAIEESRKESLFPCHYPVSPHMRDENTRLQSFSDRIQVCSASCIHAPPQETSKAGFFYLGQGNLVKCWYCNGELQNWAETVDPWFEHAKLYPTCEFVLQRKGPEFVYQVASRVTSLNRAQSTNSFDPTSTTSACIADGMVISSSGSDLGQPLIIDWREEIRRINRAVSLEILSSETVILAKVMGFSDEEIRRATTRHFQLHSSGFTSVEDLVDAILSDATEHQRPHTCNKENNLSEGSPVPATLPSTIADLQNELVTLELSRTCKVCLKKAADAVFLPCGHIASCVSCAAGANDCPLCKTSANGFVHCTNRNACNTKA